MGFAKNVAGLGGAKMKNSFFKKHRTLCTSFVSLMLLSFCFVLASELIHAGHKCSGDDCPVCLLLNTVQRTLRSIENSPNTHFLLHLMFAVFALVFFFSNSNIQKETPVSKKIRKNN